MTLVDILYSVATRGMKVRALSKELLAEYGKSEDDSLAGVREYLKRIKQERQKQKEPSLYYLNKEAVSPEQFNLTSCDRDADLFRLAEYIQATALPRVDWDEGFQLNSQSGTLPRSFLLDAIHEASSSHILFHHEHDTLQSPEERKEPLWSEEEMKRMNKSLKKAERAFPDGDDPDFRSLRKKLGENQVKLSPTEEDDSLWSMDSSALLAFGWAAEAFIERMLYFTSQSIDDDDVLGDDVPCPPSRAKPLESDDSWIEGDEVLSDSSD